MLKVFSIKNHSAESAKSAKFAESAVYDLISQSILFKF